MKLAEYCSKGEGDEIILRRVDSSCDLYKESEYPLQISCR